MARGWRRFFRENGANSMFSDRFSGIRGQKKGLYGGNREGERGGGKEGWGRALRGWKGEWEQEGGAGDDGGGAPPLTGRHGRMENGWPSGGSNQGKKLTGAEIRSTH